MRALAPTLALLLLAPAALAAAAPPPPGKQPPGAGSPARPASPPGAPARPASPSGVPARPASPSGVPAQPASPSGVPAQPASPSGVPAQPASPSASAARQAPASPSAGPVLRDRIVAIVDEDPILESDIDRIVGLGLATPNPGESERAFSRRVLGQLIDQRLRFHEIDRFGFGQVPVDQIEQGVQEIRSRFASQAELEKRLRELGLSLSSLRQLVARQRMVWTYVNERLGPRVFVSIDDIKKYYDTVLVPEMKQRGEPVPPIESVREQIRSLLQEQRLNTEIDKWTEELRQRADVANYFDSPTGPPLPPVVQRIDRPAQAGARPPRPAERPGSGPAGAGRPQDSVVLRSWGARGRGSLPRGGG